MTLVLGLAVLLTGCSNYRLTTGYKNNEFIRYGGEKIGMDRALLLLAENIYSYETVFDARIWAEEVDGISMGDYTKDLVKDTVEHMLFLVRMAEDRDITLTQEEKDLVQEAAEAYMATYDEPEELPFTVDTVEDYYTDLFLAERVFYQITSSVDTEVSTDEARIIDVQYLFFAKSELDEEGNVVALSEASCNKKRQKAEKVLGLIEEGEDLINLVSEYSDDSSYYLELGRGEYDADFEEAAFALEMGEVSPVVETTVGYYIIKCTNDNVSDDYERRKESIVLERRTELFASVYGEYSEGAELYYNERFWNAYDIESCTKGSGQLQTIFEEYLSESARN